MLIDVIESCGRMIELCERAAEGKLHFDLENDQILNSAGLPNQYYTQAVRRWTKLRAEHPTLCAIYSIGYYATHLQKAKKIQEYAAKMLNAKKNNSL